MEAEAIYLGVIGLEEINWEPTKGLPQWFLNDRTDHQKVLPGGDYVQKSSCIVIAT